MSLLIQGLNQYEAIVVGDSIVLQLTPTQYAQTQEYLIDGEIRQVCSPQITLNKDSTIKLVNKGGVNTVAIKRADGVVVPYADYIRIRDAYTEDGEPCYPTLEEEFAHRKLLQEYDGSEWVKETIPDTYQDIEIKVAGEVADTGCEHIENALSYGQGKFNNSGYYCVNALSVISKTVEKFAKEYSMITHQSSGGIEYVQMGGSYVWNSSFKYNSYFRNGGKRVCVTLQDAKEVVYTVENDTWKYLTLKYGTTLKVTPESASVIQGKIASIQNRVNSLDVKQKSDGTLRLLKKEIVELQEALYGIIKGETD